MVKKVFSSLMAVVMLFLCVPMMAHALPENIVLEEHGADGDTSGTSSDYWIGGNALWADKSIFDNGDGSMNVLISLQARQVDGDPEGEPVGAVIDGSLIVNDVLGSGFSFGDSVSVNIGSSYVYSVSGGWSGSEPDGVSVSVSGSNLSVSISGDTLLSAGGAASISYVANCSATTSGTYYVSGGCTVTASGAMADRSESFMKSSDVVQDGAMACSVEISGGYQTSELGNNGYVKLSEIQYYTDSYQYDDDYPADVMATLPSGGAQYVSGSTVTATAPSAMSVRGSKDGQDGTWTFGGWDTNEKTADSDIVFVGAWSFEADPTAYHEFYQYDGITDEDVLATLPVRSEAYYNGNTVVPMSPSSEVVMTDAGTYVFNGWSPESVIIADADALFTGTWLFEPKSEPEPDIVPETTKLHVMYQYDGVVVDEVASTLPTDDSEYDAGATITPILPDPATIETDAGVWMFGGWSRTDNENTVVFTGTWSFTEKQQGGSNPEPSDITPSVIHVLYQYSGVTEESVLATLPTDSNEYGSFDEVSSTAPSQIEVVVSTGKWDFNGWDRVESDGLVTFTGSWSFTENTTEGGSDNPDASSSVYHVLYEYTGTDDEGVLSTLPVDHTDYNNGAVIIPSNPAFMSISTETGVWSFDGWQPVSLKINSADVKFTGNWTFTPNQTPVNPSVASYYVIYTYDSVTDPDVWATVPQDDTAYNVGTEVEALSPTSTEVTTTAGTWTFVGWDAQKKTMGNEDLTFIGTWTFTEASGSGDPTDPDHGNPDPVVGGKYRVFYGYADITDSEVLATLPSDANEYDSGEQIVPMSPSSTLIIQEAGMWSFQGWDQSLRVIDATNVSFVGTWTFIPNVSDYGVAYQYSNADSLPVDVKNTLPSDANRYQAGAVVNAVLPSSSDLTVDGVRWIFVGWDANSQTVSNSDIVFTGTWNIYADQQTNYHVSYEYTESDTLPTSIKATLPVDSSVYASGAIVSAIAPSAVEMTVDGQKWQFEGWDADQKQVANADVKFVGTWSVATNPQPDQQYYGEHYMYSGSVGEAVLATLPTRVGAYQNGATVVPAQPTETEVAVTGGKWVFVGWDADAKVIQNSDVTFYGEWNFVSSTAYFGEHYVYEGITDEDVLATLPARQGAYENGAQVFPVNPSSEIVITDEGTWSFIGWTPTVATVLNGDVTFYGNWDFVAKEVTKYTEVYQYSEITDEAVLATLPTRKGQYVNGDSVVPMQPSTTTVETADGVYVFNGWDTASRVVTDADVVFTGTWTFTPNEGSATKFSEKYAYADVTEPLVLATLPTRAEKYDIGVLVIPANPSATTISTEAGTWTFNGWDVAGRVIIDQDVTFVGTWTFKEKEDDPIPPPSQYYNEFYRYVGFDTMPDEVKATIPLRAGSYVTGDVVVPAQPSATVVNLANGTWTFNGWDAEFKTVVTSDITFVGTWTFEEHDVPPEPPVVHYVVKYQYDKTYDTQIMQTLPATHGEYSDGDVVEAEMPAVTSIRGVVDGVEGTWTFGGWDESSKTVDKADVVFVGTWNFTPDGSHQKYTEFYKYDADYPTDVMATLPLSARMFENGTVVTPANPTESIVEGNVDGRIGVWKFNGWDEPQKIVNNAAVIFTGSWTFEPESSYLTNVTLKIVWIDNNDSAKIRPEKVYVQLYGDKEEVVGVDLVATQNYQAVLENLPARKDGVAIQYSVSEEVPEGYGLSLTSKYVEATSDTPGSIEFILTNTVKDQGIELPETGSMTAIWVGLCGMLLVLVGIIVFRPKRKHE